MPHSSPEKASDYRARRYAAIALSPARLEEKRAAERARYHAKKNDPDWRARKQKSEVASRLRCRSRRLESMSASKLKKLYGITREEYAVMLASQGGQCAICRKTNGAHRLAVDHCHATGRVRGLLCHGCNHVLGKMKDDPALLRAAAAYLER